MVVNEGLSTDILEYIIFWLYMYVCLTRSENLNLQTNICF
jgi:hypothetical protein